MALSLARASAQIQAYVDFLHQYNRLPPRSLKRFEDRPARRALARTVREGKRPRLAGHEFSAVRFRSVSGESAEAVLGIDRRLRPARPLRAFVGHRFTPEVTNTICNCCAARMASASGTRIRICRTAQFSRPSFSASAKATSACSTIAKPKCGRTC